MSRPLRVVLAASDLALPDWVPAQLAESGIQFTCHLCDDPAQVPVVCAEADVVWVMGGAKVVRAEALGSLPHCRVLLRTGTGTDNMPVAEATRRGIYVANTPEATTHTVAEHAIGLLFSVTRQIVAQDRLMRQGIWDRDRAWPNWSFQGRVLGLVGFGRIAQQVAAKTRGLELRVLAFDPGVDAATMQDRQVEKVDLDELLERTDYLSIHAPLTDSTRHMIGEPQLRRMKRSAVLVNTSRGPLVEETALYRALREGWIAAAGLDVFEQEPLPLDHPLLSLPNLVATPHIASYSDEFAYNFWSHSVRTLQAVAREGKPIWIVNPAAVKG